MKQFAYDLWKKFKFKLLLVTGLMVLDGAIEGLGIILFLPFITLLSGGEFSSYPILFLNKYLVHLDTPVSLIKLTFIIISVFICQTGISMQQGRLIAKIESTYVDIWRRELLTAILEARWSFFINHKKGQLLFAFGTETERIGRAFLLSAQIVSAVILVSIYFIIAMYLSWEFSLLLVVFGLLGFLLITRSFVRKAYETGASYAKYNSQLLGQVSESLTAAKMIKTTNSENRVLIACNKLLSILKQDYFGAVYYPYALRSMLELFIIINICTALLLLHQAGINFASIMILMALFLRILPKLQVAQSSYQMLLGNLPSFDALTSQLSIAKAAIEDNFTTDTARKLNQPVTIKFENINMSYDHHLILNNINFTIAAGTICAIVGPSGAGKSTLVDLIVSIIKPNAGRILINDIELKNMSIFNWRQAVGYVTQESLLLHDTIWNNIIWGAPESTEQDVFLACKLAHAHDFISALPHGYQTLIGEQGSKLSGGQRQRIALARALISKPSLLILDEATSALDAESEQAIIDTLRQLRGHLTILLISHRPTPITVADQILVLEQGCISDLLPPLNARAF